MGNDEDPAWVQQLPSSRETPIFSGKNCRRLLNQYSVTLAGMLSVLAVEYIYHSGPPVYISLLALVGFVVGFVGQFIQSKVCMLIYMALASVAFVYVSIILGLNGPLRVDALVGISWILFLFSLINAGKMTIVL